MHIGKICQQFKCQNLKIDGWKEIAIINEESGVEEIKDIMEGDKEMENREEEKYLGDIISCDGRNIKNVKARVAKGKGIVSRIISILDGIPFGKYYYEVGVILRNSLLISSMLFNTEAWYNITQAELELLESVDILFLRRLLNAPRATPKEMLYLELGCVPLREIIIKRRIMFLRYILNEKEESMIKRFFQTQLKNPTKKDWVKTVEEDLKNLKIELNFDEIKKMSKASMKRLLNEAIDRKALQRLNIMKGNHSKVMKINHTKLKMQNYLRANNSKISQNESQIIFKLRSRTTKVKMNYKKMFDNLECNLCREEKESQNHILDCRKIREMKGNDENNEKEIDYKNILGENVKKQRAIAKCFEENMRIKEKLENLV